MTTRRLFDVAVGGVTLVVLSPLLGAAAVAIKLEDGGRVLYRQTRVGKDGVDFELLKLRTMVVGAETMGAGYAVNRGDSRITRLYRRIVGMGWVRGFGGVLSSVTALLCSLRGGRAA